MALEVIHIHGVPVYMFVPDNLPELPKGRRVDQEELFDATEGKQEARSWGKKTKGDDR